MADYFHLGADAEAAMRLTQAPALPEFDGKTLSEAWQELVEYDDRTSPVEYPDMALITRDELAIFMGRAAPDLAREVARLRGEYERGYFDGEGKFANIVANMQEQIAAKDAEIARLRDQVAGHRVLVMRQEVQEIPYISKSSTKGRLSTYRPKVGETCLISGPNCDDGNRYIFAEMAVLWCDETFILYGAPGFWPNLARWEHIICKPRAALAKGAE